MQRTIKQLFFFFTLFIFFLFPKVVKAFNVSDFGEIIISLLSTLGLGAPIGYLISFLFRLPFLFLAIVGFFIGVIAIFVGGLIVPPFVNALIDLGLNQTVFKGFLGTWEIVKDFALSFVRIFLLLIGVATIFRIFEYDARKTLVPLIISALLVSFSFPISTTLISWGNALTNFISTALGVGGSTEGYLGTDLTEIYDTLLNALISHLSTTFDRFIAFTDLQTLFTKDNVIFALISLSTLILGLISIYISFVLLALGIVFVLRLVFLTCLVIVSPIAFLTAGLRTREIRQIFGGFLNWDGWWATFLEWVFIGVILLIWLKVGVLLLGITKELDFKLNTSCNVEDTDINNVCNQEIGFIAEQLIKFLPALTFALAIHIGVKTSPGVVKQAVESAIGMVKLATTVAITAGTFALGGAMASVGAATRAWGAARLAGVSRRSAFGASVKAFGKEWARVGPRIGRSALSMALSEIPPELGKIMPEPFKPGIETVESIKKGVGWTKRMVVLGREGIKKEMEARMEELERKRAREEIEEVYKKHGKEGLEKMIRSRWTSEIEKGEATKKLLEEGKLSDDLIEKDEFKKFLRTKEGGKYLNDVLKLRVDLAPEFINPKTNRPFTPKDILDEITPKDVIKIRPKAIMDPEVVSAMSPTHIERIIRAGTIKQKDALVESYTKMIAKDAKITLDTSTRENLRKGISDKKNRKKIQDTINNLRKSPNPSDVNKAEIIKEIGDAIWQRRL